MHEENKTYLITGNTYGLTASLYVIHPVYAMMLSFFNGEELSVIFNKISDYFNLSEEKVEHFLTPLIKNKQRIKNKFGAFPKNLIVEYDAHMPKHNYKPEDFTYGELDLRISRFKKPVDLVFNVTMKCRTSCLYCYADRKNPNGKNLLPIERVESIIEEAKELGVIKLKLMGGEVFMHKDWYRILKKLSECGYRPDLSTKVPLKQRHIEAIKELNIAPIQFSLDTMIKSNLYKVLNVKDPYYQEVLDTFELLETNKIEYSVHTVISNLNDSIEDIDSLKDFFLSKKYLIEWAFDVAKCSMYLDYEYSDYKITYDRYLKLKEYIKNIDNENIFNFKLRLPFARNYKESYNIDKLKELYSQRTPCSGNLLGFYILPDGKVTLCEELYWHPRFIIGDLRKQSIMEVWNSSKALDLFHLRQDSLQEKSACRTCDIFSKCREYKHVCWRDVILGYGHENWDYPDLFCHKAPKIQKDIFLYPTPQ